MLRHFKRTLVNFEKNIELNFFTKITNLIAKLNLIASV